MRRLKEIQEEQDRKQVELSEPGRILLEMWEEQHNPLKDELGKIKQNREK